MIPYPRASHAEACLNAAPDPWSWSNLAAGLIRVGRLEDASRAVERLGRESPHYPQCHSLGAVLAALQGDPARAGRGIERAQQARQDFGHYHHVQYDVACALAALGDKDAAMTWLRAAAVNGYPCPTLFAIDPLLDPLRGHDDFSHLMQELETERALPPPISGAAGEARVVSRAGVAVQSARRSSTRSVMSSAKPARGRPVQSPSSGSRPESSGSGARPRCSSTKRCKPSRGAAPTRRDVAVVGTETLEVTARFPVGEMPWGIAMGHAPRTRPRPVRVGVGTPAP